MLDFQLENILPHRAPIILLDKIIENSSDRLTAYVYISEKTFGLKNGVVPAWFGIEYMAQAIAAFNGLNFSRPGSKPEIGFLVGVRNYESLVSEYSLGDELLVKVAPNFIVENSGTFDCEINIGDKTVAKAVITTYKPSQEMITQLQRRDS